MNRKLALLGLGLPAIGFLWLLSFLIHWDIYSFESNVELVPDFIITYYCPSSYKPMKDLLITRSDDNHYVTVNYGGLGRRRGFRNFKCNHHDNQN